MAITAAQLVANVSVLGADQAKSALSDVGSAADKTGGIFKSSLGGALTVAAGAGLVAVGGLTAGLVDSVKVAMQHQQVMSQTAQVLKSTKDASGETAQSISNMSEALSKTTMFSDDSIQSGQNLLLTFTNIGKNVFPQTTQAMLDLSQATGQSLTSSAMQLGKALNDPVQGMNALSRVGVSFSAQEKEQIKTMMAHNDIMGAQKIILGELSTEFGGSATAAGKTFAGQLAILKNSFEDLKQHIGGALLPILSQFLGAVTSGALPVLQKFSDWFVNSAVPGIQKFFDKLQPLGSLFSYVGGLASKAFKDVQDIFFQIGEIIQPITDQIGGMGGKLGGMSSIVNTGKGIAKSLYDTFHGAATDVEKILSTVNIRPLVDSFSGMLSHIDFKSIGNIASSVGKMIGDAFSHIDFKAVGNDVKTIGQIFLNLSPAGNIIQALSSHAQELGKWFNTSVVPALKGAEPGFKSLGQAIAGLLPAFLTISGVVRDVFQKAFDALLPVFMKAIPIIIQIAGIVANGLGSAIKFLTPYITQAITAIGKFADEIIQRVAPIVSQWFSNLKTGLDDFMRIWNAVWPVIAPILKGVWDEILGVIKIAWALITGFIKIALDVLSGNWQQAWTDLKDMLAGVWDGIKTYLQGAWEIITGIFNAARNTISGIFHGLVNDIINVLNGGISALEGFVDGIENAINAVAKGLGAGAILQITHIGRIPAYADGTPAGGHPGGAALVGERGPEIALLPRGTSVIPAEMSKQMLAGVPAYANGTGNIAQEVVNWIAGGAQNIINNMMKGLNLNFNLGAASNLASDFTNSIEKWALGYINKLLPGFGGGGGGSGGSAGPGTPVNVPGNLMSWIMSAIALTGVSASWANDLAVIAMHESGGNPNAINNWDINAQEGHPSQGIMQTIPSTFAAHMVAGHGNILNPVDNIAAAIGYIQAAYGSVFNVPGIVSMSHGGAYQGYADGTNFAPGGMAWVGERGKELMYVPRGAQIVPHEQLSAAAQQPQIIVNPPGIYLDGRTLVNGLMPYIADAIRYNVGTHNI